MPMIPGRNYLRQHIKTFTFLRSIHIKILPTVCTRHFSSTNEKDDAARQKETREKVEKYMEDRPHTARVKLFWTGLSKFKKTILICIAATAVLFYVRKLVRIKTQRDMLSKLNTSGLSYGELSIGGPFELTDTKGNIVTSDSLKGNWVILYFGFTYCPDICPEQMEMMGALVDIAAEKHGISIIPVMITIDPERDTAEVMEEYLADYNPKIIGLTGSEEQLNKPCRSYRVYRSKGLSLDDDNDYILDHTVTQYLLNPDGKAVGYFMSNRDLAERVPILLENIEKYNKMKEEEEQSWFSSFKKMITVT